MVFSLSMNGRLSAAGYNLSSVLPDEDGVNISGDRKASKYKYFVVIGDLDAIEDMTRVVHNASMVSYLIGDVAVDEMKDLF